MPRLFGRGGTIRTGRPPARPGPPCLLLGQLATGQNSIGKGRMARASSSMHCNAVSWPQTSPEVARWLSARLTSRLPRSVGGARFIPSKDDPLILFRSIADIAASLR